VISDNSKRSADKVLVVATCAFDYGKAFKFTNAPINFRFTETSTSVKYDMFTNWDSMKAILLVHASVVRMNSFCMLGKARIGADVRAFLRKSNSC